MKTVSAIIVMILFFGCTGRSPKESKPVTPDLMQAEDLTDLHNSRNSLDFTGTYEGILPCADCSGIETGIQINLDSTFMRKTSYLGKDDKQVFEEKGTYSWNEAGNTIILNEIKNGPNQYFVGENVLIQLDLEGNRISGDLAELYVLKKVKL